ncbi:hypothetical protein [Halonatronum saccharophilum]|nr:hypothetical protein [Halonatronum saccharophilum]
MNLKDIKYAKLDDHQKRKIEDMQLALNLDREENDKVIVLAVEED